MTYSKIDTFDWGFCSFWNDCDASWKGEILDEAQLLGHSSGTLNHIRNNLGFIFLFNFLFYPTFKLALFCPLERCGHSHWSIQPTLNLEFSTPRTENRHIYSSPIQYFSTENLPLVKFLISCNRLNQFNPANPSTGACSQLKSYLVTVPFWADPNFEMCLYMFTWTYISETVLKTSSDKSMRCIILLPT